MATTRVRMELDESAPRQERQTSDAIKEANARAAAEAGRVPTLDDALQTDDSMQEDEQQVLDADEAAAGTQQQSDDSSRIPPGFPRALFTEGYSYGVRIMSDRLSVQYVSKAMHLLDVGTVRSVEPIPKAARTGVYYFEAAVVDAGERNQITIGIAPLQSSCLFAPANMHAHDTPVPAQASLRQHDTASLTCRQVGMDMLSYGYRADDGKKFHGAAQMQAGRQLLAGAPYGPTFSTGDVVGCGINYYDRSVFFTRNGRNLGPAFTLKPEDWLVSATQTLDVRTDFYAAVSLHSKGEHVKVNFGAEPFQFDVESFAASERVRVEKAIGARPFDKAMMLPLIRSYLLHAGYEKSLEALNQMSSGETPSSMQDASKAPTASSQPQTRHDVVAAQTMQARRNIRDMIEAGEIEQAMAAIDQLAPALWTTPTLVTIASPLSVSALHLRLLSLRFIALLTSSSPTRVLDAIAFAQQHLLPFQSSDEASVRRSVEELMSLLAFPDVHASPLAHLLTEAYRMETADRVNAAILASLCAPSQAASSAHGVSSLELLLRHALATQHVLHTQGFPVALPSMMPKDE